MVNGLFLGISLADFILAHNFILNKEHIIGAIIYMFMGIFFMWLAFKKEQNNEVKAKCSKKEKAGL